MSGIDRLSRRLQQIPKSVKESVAPALVKSAEEVASRMKALAPEDTGDLKRSITVTPPGQTTPAYSQPGGSQVARENQALVTAGNENVRYAHLAEYGTTKTAAKPFFWPAWRLTRERAKRRIKRAISKSIKDGWKA